MYIKCAIEISIENHKNVVAMLLTTTMFITTLVRI